MRLRPFSLAIILALVATGAQAQTRVRTESIKPPGAAATPPAPPAGEDKKDKPAGKPTSRAQAAPSGTPPEIITDLSRLPAAVAATRERILAAAKSGELAKLVTIMRAGETLPVFSLSDDKDPAAFWKANYPDSDGVEVLSILTEILEAPFVHVERGTPEEMYLWPYFARMSLKRLSAEQKVALFRIVTGADYRDMLDFGAYSFYRLGIGPDGVWHYFVSGD
jgi:hypothetical protein